MSHTFERVANLPSEQQAVRAKCFHPTGTFVEFRREEIEQSIPDRFEQMVRKHGGWLAVKAKDRSLTYHELNQAANRVAQAILRLRGEKPEPVAILLEHGVPMIVAILGVLKAGKFYVPLDSLYPSARIAHILDDSQAGLIVTGDENSSLAEEFLRDSVGLLNTDCLDANLSDRDPGLTLSPDTLSWIHYTSGSTGKSKGVIQNHRNVLHFLMNYTNGLHVCSDDRLTQVNRGVQDVLSALLKGASVHPLDVRKEGPTGIAEWLIQEEITIYHSFPTLFRHFVQTLSGDEDFRELRVICLEGEPVYRRDAELYKKWFRPSCIFVNRLGGTEARSIRWYFLDPGTRLTGGTVPVGYAFDDTEVLLIGDDGNPVSGDGIGEIAIRSRYLSPGYWRRPDLTRAKFLPDPEGGEERIYLTGDLGRMASDGCLSHLGRKDFQVKIRGYRVEVGEIEMALSDVEGVQEVVVVARGGNSGDQRLVAYFVAGRKPAPTVSALRRALAEKLPDYMVPSAFVMLDALPLTGTGKVNLSALPEDSPTRPELENTLTAPRDSLELRLTTLWEKVLEIHPIGITDNFFDLGGHSLLAVRLFTEIDRIFGRKLPLVTLLRAPTIEQLASILRSEGEPVSSSSLVAIQPNGDKPPFFCVYAHDRNTLRFRDLAQRLAPDQPFYGLILELDRHLLRHDRVGDFASHYIQQIRALQSEGPYFLGGYCAGAKIALEIAHQLHGENHKVALLAVIDAYAPGYLKLRPWMERSKNRVRYHWDNLRRLGVKDKLDYVVEKGKIALARIERSVKKIVGRASRTIRFSAAPDLLELQQEEEVPADGRRLSRNYPRKAYPGRITVLAPTEGLDSYYHDLHMGWESWAAGELEIHEVPGKFSSIIVEPSIRFLAQQLRDSLDKARRT
jgi:amino acid adenylation domain-containing protein